MRLDSRLNGIEEDRELFSQTIEVVIHLIRGQQCHIDKLSVVKSIEVILVQVGIRESHSCLHCVCPSEVL